jgi:hypothetical protein
MAVFLKILLAVILVIAALVLVAFLWFRRWLRRSLAASEVASGLIDPRHSRPARIRLLPHGDHEPGAVLRQEWGDWHALGFRKLGDHGEYNGAFTTVRLAVHPDYGLGLALAEDTADSQATVLFALTHERQLLAVSAGLGPALESATVSWALADGQTPGQRVDTLRARLGNARARVLDHRSAKAVFERAWALVMDADIAAGPPTVAEIEAHAAARGIPAPNAQLEQAVAIATSQWQTRLEEAVLDNWRRSSHVDAVTWTRVQDDVHVVRTTMDEQSLRTLLCSDDLSTAIFDQLLAQGWRGVELYEQVQRRLPARHRRERLGEVTRPLPAVLFVPGEGETSDADAGARVHGYEAVDQEGRTVSGGVLATDVADALQQLAGSGLSEVRIVTEPGPGVPDSPLAADPELARQAVRSLREPLAMAVARALLASAWIWLPPLLLLIWAVRGGAPYGWGDWLTFIYAGLAATAMFALVAPMVIYNQLLRAKLLGRWSLASAWLAVLRLRILSGALSAVQLTAERCKILAGQGRAVEALSLWAGQEAELPADQYCSELAQIHDAAGDSDAMIEAQRRLIELSQAADTPRIDLAMSLARFRRAADEAEQLLDAVPADSLSEPALCGYHYARGLILAERLQHAAALHQYQIASDKARQYTSMPTIAGLIAEINGYVALSLRELGEIDRADDLWRSVLPLLQASASSRGLIDRYGGIAVHAAS